MPLTHKQAQQIGRIGGLTRAANGDIDTSAARAAFNNWEAKVDPAGVLPEAERRRRAQALKKLHYARAGKARSDAAQRRATRQKRGSVA